jgi:hypothetical protein
MNQVTTNRRAVMKNKRVFIDKDGNKVVGIITTTLIDLYLANGSRIYSTSSEGYTLELVKSLGLKNTGN